jgi:hypothetical protein
MRLVERFGAGLWVFGCALVLSGERFAADDGVLRPVLDGVGIALLLLVLVVRALELRALDGAARAGVRHAFFGYLLAAGGLLLYPLASAAVTDRLGLEENGARAWRAAWTCAWVLLSWVGTLAALAADWARSGVREARNVEARRVRAASAGAMSFALAVGWVFALNYVAEEHDRLWEWSRSSRARASEATLELVAGLGAPVGVVAFFPPANEVLRRIEPFLDEVSRSGKVEVEVLDQAMEPGRAAELGARSNGVLFVVRGEDRERIDLDTDYERAKRQLGDLDRRFQEALLQVGRSRATMHLTAGHGERERSESEDGAPGVRNALDILRLLNVDTRTLSVTDLIQEPPGDAALIAIFGPTRRFLPEEVDSLVRFWRLGGSLLVLLEPGIDHGLDPLLAELGIEQLAGTVANERYHLRREGGPGDRRLLITNRFGSHEVVSELSRLATEIGFVVDGAVGLATLADAPARTSVLVRPMRDSWLERDGDFERDVTSEPAEIEALAMAASHRRGEGDGESESRAVVLGDVDAFADPFVVVSRYGSMSANAKLLLDSYLWLSGEGDWEIPSVPGDDDPILERTRAESIRWFVSTVFGVPALMLVCGLLYTRWRRTRSRRSGGEA